MAEAQRGPTVMQGPIPCLAPAGRSAKAMAFWARAFGASDIGRMPDPADPSRLMHGQVEINGGALMLTDHMGDDGGSGPVMRRHMQLAVADGRAWWDRAVAAGCDVVRPFARQFRGGDRGLLRDPFGVHWGIMQDGSVA